MCKLGDIIVIDEFKDGFGKKVKRHSFVVINGEGNYIQGLKYDFVCNMSCSFHNEEHKIIKISYKSNLEITENDITIKNSNNKKRIYKS